MMRSIFRDLDVATFLRRHWQKRPLLARNALAKYAECISRTDVFELATREEIESRIVVRARNRWHVKHGPFLRRELERLPRSGWTLLVQGVDHVMPDASHLLREFSFIPYARLDDVMVSYAAPASGVGPHFDSYDVFLVQGTGKRCWRVSAPRHLEVDQNAPLKILKRFDPDDEWLLEPGDVLYVPPQWPHDGIALGECITYSVGFRAPSAQELASRFLEFLQDELRIEGEYSDPNLAPTGTPGHIDAAMSKRLGAMLARIRWSNADADRFIGSFLSEPKPNVVFDRPRRPLPRQAFDRAVRTRGVRLALPTRMLYDARSIFINGEARRGGRDRPLLRRLSDARELPPQQFPAGVTEFLYDAYLAGYIRLGSLKSWRGRR